MKRLLAIIAILASGFVLSAAAQTPAAAAPAAPAKVALVAFQPLVQQTNDFQRKLADLQTKYAPRQAKLKALNDEIENLTKQLQAQSDKLSPAELAARAKVIEDKKKQLERDAEDLKNDGGAEAQEMFNSVAGKVGDVMVAYAQQQGYTMVLDYASQQCQMLWSDGSADITKAVLDLYNQKSGVPAPPAQPAAAAPARPAAAKPPVHHQ